MKVKMVTETTNGDDGKGNSGGKTKSEGDDKEGNNSRRATTKATRKTGTADVKILMEASVKTSTKTKTAMEAMMKRITNDTMEAMTNIK